MWGAAVDRDVLAEDVAVADLDAGRLVVVLEVLRALPEDGAAEDNVALAHRERADQVSVRAQHAAGADTHPAFDNGVRADHDIVPQLRLGGDDGGGMDARRYVRHLGTRIWWDRRRRGNRRLRRSGRCGKLPLSPSLEKELLAWGVYTTIPDRTPEEFAGGRRPHSPVTSSSTSSAT